jgi:hypothetical protein
MIAERLIRAISLAGLCALVACSPGRIRSTIGSSTRRR